MKFLKAIESFQLDDPLAPTPTESARANKALQDYAHMGSRRSLHGLEKRYMAMDEEWKKNPSRTEKPPSTRWMTISNWSSVFRWQERVRVYDEQVRKAEEERYLDDKLKWRDLRMKAAKNLLTKAIVALNNHEGRDNLAQISRALEAAMKELRIEFGEEQQISTANEISIRVIREDKKSIASGEE